MALTRRMLTAMGIEGEKIDEIIAAHAETVDGLKDERDQAKSEALAYKEDAGKLAAVTKELEDLKEEVKKGNADPFEDKYNALKDEYETYKTEQAAKETAKAKEKAYRQILKEAGVSEKRLDSIIKVTNLGDYEFDEEGKFKDADSIKEGVKSEWSDFIVTEQTRGAETHTPPANNGTGGKPLSYAAQRAAEYHRNLYGETKEV